MRSQWCREVGRYQLLALCSKGDITTETQPQVQTNTYWCGSPGILLWHPGLTSPSPTLSGMRCPHQLPPRRAFLQHLSRRRRKCFQHVCEHERPQSKAQRWLLLLGDSGPRWTQCVPAGTSTSLAPAAAAPSSSHAALHLRRALYISSEPGFLALPLRAISAVMI